LLKDFLEHVVREVAFADVFCAVLDFADLVIAGLARDRTDFELIARDRDDIEVVKINRVAGVSDDRAHVAGEKVFVFANAEHKGRTATRANHEFLDIGMNERDAVSADHLL